MILNFFWLVFFGILLISGVVSAVFVYHWRFYGLSDRRFVFAKSLYFFILAMLFASSLYFALAYKSSL